MLQHSTSFPSFSHFSTLFFFPCTVLSLACIAHNSFSLQYTPPTPQPISLANIQYSPHNGNANDDQDGLPTTSHKSSFTEIAKAPLKIYVPAAPPPNHNPLNDIWATSTHKAAQEDATHPLDKEAYYKALNCPVCEDSKDAKDCPSWDEVLKEAPFDVSRCPSVQSLKNANHKDTGVPAGAGGKPLISYIYIESPTSRANLAFFANHALHDGADFAFLLYGATSVDDDILPKGRNNIYISRKPLPKASCNPIASHFENLSRKGKQGRKQLKDIYERFILMDSSMRGPFIPRWSSSCWSSAFLTQLAEKTKLVSTHLNCAKDHRPYLQTHMLGTDRAGLTALIADKRLKSASCPDSQDARDTKSGLIQRDVTAAIRDKGWEAVVLDMAWRDVSEFRYLKCETDGDHFVPKGNETVSIDPWEVLFLDAGEGKKEDEKQTERREREKAMLQLVSARVGASGYSSYEACK